MLCQLAKVLGITQPSFAPILQACLNDECLVITPSSPGSCLGVWQSGQLRKCRRIAPTQEYWCCLIFAGCLSSFSSEKRGAVVTPMRSGRSSAMSTNSPAWIQLTSFRGTGGKPAPIERTGDMLAAPLNSPVLCPSLSVMWCGPRGLCPGASLGLQSETNSALN